MRLGAILLLASLLPWSGGLAKDIDVRKMDVASSAVFDLPEDAAYLAAVKKYGECVVRDSKMMGSNTLRLVPFSNQSVNELVDLTLSGTSCDTNGKTPAVSPLVLRGVIAEYYLANDFSLPGLESQKRAKRVFRMPDPNDRQKLEPMAAHAIQFIEIGECVAARDAGNLAALFQSDMSTRQEASAFARLEPTFAKCLPNPPPQPVGSFELRGYLAEGAYRYAVAKLEAAE